MGPSKEIPEDGKDHETVSHGDIMSLLRTMQEEQREFRKDINARLSEVHDKIDAIEVHNYRQDHKLAQAARHMTDVDGDLGMLSQYMHSMQAVKEAHVVYERACSRMKSSAALRHIALPPDTPTNPENLRPKEEEDLPDTIPPPSRAPDTER